MPILVAALWWGSLCTIGFLVAPMLFVYLPSPAIAGAMASKLFTAQNWVTLVSGLLLLALSRPRGEARLFPWAAHSIGWVTLGMLLALLLEFVVAPHIVARDDLKFWHSLGTVMFAGQWLCASVMLWRLTGLQRQ